MIRRTASSAARPTLAAVAAGAALLTLAACSPAPVASTSPSPSLSGTTSTTPEAPILHPDGGAEENLPLFAAVTAQVWATDQRVSGRAYIDGLIAAGFDRAAMQVTPDRSTVGNPAESIQFSVRWGEAECLVGQVGPSTGEPVTVVLPQLADGRCLIGATRPIDW